MGLTTIQGLILQRKSPLSWQTRHESARKTTRKTTAVWITLVFIYQFENDELSVGLFFSASWKLGLALAYSMPALLLAPVLSFWFRKPA